MGHESHIATSGLRGLTWGDRETRWTAVMDGTIGAAVVIWALLLTFADPSETLRWVVPLIISIMVVHRVLVLVEHSHRIPREDVPVTLSSPGVSHDAAHAA
jgi:Co/Zn/Cd efflux system component